MTKTWGVLGTIFTGGALGLEAYGTYAAFGTGSATTGTYFSLGWSTTSFTVGTYNTVNSFTNGKLPAGNIMGSRVGFGVDMVDAFRYANPFGIVNLGIRIAEWQLKKGGKL